MIRKIFSFLLISCIVFGVHTYDNFDFLDSPTVRELELEEGTFEMDPFTSGVFRTDTVNCTKPGLVCEDCSTVSYCIQLGNVWLKEKLYNCSSGETCLASTGNCSSQSNPDCDSNISGYKFTCHQIGLFPDAYSCGLYHLCIPEDILNPAKVNPDSIALKCDKGFAYDPVTNHCSIEIINGSCPSSGLTCSTIGETRSLAQNPRFYYICLRNPDDPAVLIPNLFYCLNNQVFDDASKSCKVNKPDNGTDATGLCNKRGNFPVKDDCFSYNYCGTVNSAPQKAYCYYKTYFNPKTQSCVDFKCSDLNRNY